MATLNQNISEIEVVKGQIKQAISDKGVDTSSATFKQYPSLIATITTGNNGVMSEEDYVLANEQLDAILAGVDYPIIECPECPPIDEDKGDISYTGHVDVEGLKAIGWSDDEIAGFQKYGVTWNAEDDAVYVVSDANKAMYGVVDWKTLYNYADICVWLPNIQFVGVLDLAATSSSMYRCIGAPTIHVPNTESCSGMFKDFTALTYVHALNLTNTKNISNMFQNCYNLLRIGDTNIPQVTGMRYTFSNCYKLENVQDINSEVLIENLVYCFSNCYKLKKLPNFIGNTTNYDSSTFINCNSVTKIPQYGKGPYNATSLTNIKTIEEIGILNLSSTFSSINFPMLRKFDISSIGLNYNITIDSYTNIDKQSLLTLINSATKANLIITLRNINYFLFKDDADVIKALAAKEITLAKK